MSQYLSFDVGGTTVKYALANESGALSEQGSFATVNQAEQFVSQLVQVINRFKNDFQISGVGIAAPGIIRNDGYLVTAGAITALNSYPLGAELRARCQLPVVIENDANAAAIAEHWVGGAQKVNDYLTVVLGTGVGGGIVINGAIYRGSHGMAGEFGWNLIHDISDSSDLEAASINQHVATVSGFLHHYNLAQLAIDPLAKPATDAAKVIAAAVDGDPVAGQAYQAFLRDTAVMLMGLFANFDPELILIGGGISANNRFMADLEQKLATLLSHHESLNRIKTIALGRIAPAGLRNNAGLIGAAYTVHQRLNQHN
ncbi:ROK family protein [Lapidilactobacillus salsurivasis]